MWWLVFLLCSNWAKVYGNAGEDWGYSVWQTQDNGYIVAGGTYSCGAGGSDFLVFKLDSTGKTNWVKTFGGGYDDRAYCVQQTQDNGYIVVGETYSYGTGSLDWLVIKLDSGGDINWARTFGGAQEDVASFVQQTQDGGYIIAGWTKSFGAVEKDLLVIKLDSTGNIVWEKTFGAIADDIAHSIQQTQDGGYIIAGETADKDSYGKKYYEFLVVKLSSTGDISWAKAVRPPSGESGVVADFRAYSVQQTSDLGYIVAGEIDRYGDGDDFLVTKLTSTGDTSWIKTFGNYFSNRAYSIQQVSGGGYIVAGESKYSIYNTSYTSFSIIKLFSTGNISWAKVFSDTSVSYPRSMQQTNDKGYILIGSTNSYGMYQDILVIKLEPDGSMQKCSPLWDYGIEETSFYSLSIHTPTFSISSPSVVVSDCTPETSSVSLTVTDICPEEGVEEKEVILNSMLEISFYAKILTFSIPSTGYTSLNLYDISGRKVKNLIDEQLEEGSHSIELNELRAGIYFAVLKHEGRKISEKVVVF